MDSASLRLFIAIELNDALRAELKRAQKQVQDECLRAAVANTIRWVAPQNIHLTLNFLGNFPRAQIPALTTALERAAKYIAPFVLTARGLGCFPNARRPNTLWVGVEGDIQTAALLAQHIEKETHALGFAREERGFAPHLTLARVKRDASNHERAKLGDLVKNFPTQMYGTLHPDAIHLIASDLKPTGSIYTTLARAKFRKE